MKKDLAAPVSRAVAGIGRTQKQIWKNKFASHYTTSRDAILFPYLAAHQCDMSPQKFGAVRRHVTAIDKHFA